MTYIKYCYTLAKLAIISMTLVPCVIHFWWGLILTGELLIIIPSWRRWFVKQPGYVNFLSLYPGWLPGSFRGRRRFGFFLVPPIYVFAVFASSKWWLLPLGDMLYGSSHTSSPDYLSEPTSIMGNVLGLFGFVTFYCILTGGRLLPKRLAIKQQQTETPHPLLDHRLPLFVPSLQLTIADYLDRQTALRSLLGKPTVAKWNKVLAMLSFSVRAVPQLTLFAYFVVCSAMLGALCYYGAILGLIGAILAFMPGYRHWLECKPGYRYRLSRFWGWKRLAPLQLSLVTILYLMPASLLFWYQAVFGSGIKDHLFSVDVATFSLFGLIFLYGWSIQNWHVKLPGMAVMKKFSWKHRDFERLSKQLDQLYLQGNYHESLELAHQVVKRMREYFGELHPSYATSLRHLARLHQVLGNYTIARALYQEVQSIRQVTLGEGNLDYIESLSDLAGLYVQLGNYAEAALLYREALQTRFIVLPTVSFDLVFLFENMGLLYHRIGNYTAARECYQRAQGILQLAKGEASSINATILNHLGDLSCDLAEITQAEEFYHQAQALYRWSIGERHKLFADNLKSFALLYSISGQHHKAEQYYRQALDCYRSTLGERNQDVANILVHLGELAYTRGNYEQAESLYYQALELYRFIFGEAHPSFGNTHANLAKLLTTTGRIDGARHSMEQTLAIEDQLIGQVLISGGETQRMSYLKVQRVNMDLYLSLIVCHLADSSSDVRAGLELVLRRKAIGAETLNIRRDSILSGLDANLVKKLRELSRLNIRIAQKTLAGPSEEGRTVHQRLIAQWTARKEQLDSELARQIPEMDLELKLRVISATSIADALPCDSVLVEFVRFNLYDFQSIASQSLHEWEPHYLAFIVPAGNPDKVQMRDLGKADTIDRLISTFRTSITGEVEGVDARQQKAQLNRFGRAFSFSPVRQEVGMRLRQMIFDPLKPMLQDRIRLFLAPDGNLNWLPFEVLPTDKDDEYIIDQYHLSYLSVGRDILSFREKPTAQPTAPVVAANPDFDLSCEKKPGQSQTDQENRGTSGEQTIPSFNPLGGTLQEGKAIAKELGVVPLLGEKVLEAHLKAYRSPQILHIATHGFFWSEQEEDMPIAATTRAGGSINHLFGQPLKDPMLRSGLALAGANTWLQGGSLPDKAEDGLLTAVDVTGIDLSATELVVLSACQTGLGKVENGEGVFGLRRAFALAGARTLVMSLWKVPDQQTQELMTTFYKYILAGQPRAAALREAQLAIKHQYTHPFYWGAFICQGNPDQLNLVETMGCSNVETDDSE